MTLAKGLLYLYSTMVNYTVFAQVDSTYFVVFVVSYHPSWYILLISLVKEIRITVAAVVVGECRFVEVTNTYSSKHLYYSLRITIDYGMVYSLINGNTYVVRRCHVCCSSRVGLKRTWIFVVGDGDAVDQARKRPVFDMV